MVGAFDYIEIMLYDDKGVTERNQPVERLEQYANVVRMQARCWFVKDKNAGSRTALCEIVCQLHTLILAA